MPAPMKHKIHGIAETGGPVRKVAPNDIPLVMPNMKPIAIPPKRVAMKAITRTSEDSILL